jgi:hypothetical protein
MHCEFSDGNMGDASAGDIAITVMDRLACVRQQSPGKALVSGCAGFIDNTSQDPQAEVGWL